MKLAILLVTAVMVSVLSGSAHATMYTETFLGTTTDSKYFDVFEGYKAKFSFNLTSIGDGAQLFDANNHIIASQAFPNPDATGFVPGSTINSAFLNFNFSSSDAAAERVTVKAGVSDGNRVIGTKDYTLGNLFTQTFGIYKHADLSLDLKSLNLDQFLADGRFVTLVLALDYSQCYAPLNDFRIDQANLTVDANAAAPVPEPGTIVLLGGGLLGLALYGRRRVKK